MCLVRKATSADYDGIWETRYESVHAIDQKYYKKDELEQWTPKLMPADIESKMKAYDWYVIEDSGKVVASGFLDEGRGSLEALFVRPKFQGRGYARKILLKIEELAKQKGFACLYLESTLSAESFYKNQGYESLGKGICVSTRISLPCIKMKKELR